jgi:hypothetical protein
MKDPHLVRHIIATMGRFTGRRYQELYDEIEKMPVPALMDLNRFLQDVEGEIERERRTFRPFPGGPKIRM